MACNTPVFDCVVDKADMVRKLIRDVLDEADITSPVGLAQYVHRCLCMADMCTTDTEILYDFDEHYRIIFYTGGSRHYVEFWRSWNGALNWKLELKKD